MEVKVRIMKKTLRRRVTCDSACQRNTKINGSFRRVIRRDIRS
jgi:hypothetical protein